MQSKNRINIKSPKNSQSSIMNSSHFHPIKQQSISNPLNLMKDKSKGIAVTHIKWSEPFQGSMNNYQSALSSILLKNTKY
mmetsp:Transcript_9288/g.8211  ORF Transcript_9288/g.8211 Transcript_9288/m.8211 type:complete len:80 (+) Transcript_9288:149-388(+)